MFKRQKISKHRAKVNIIWLMVLIYYFNETYSGTGVGFITISLLFMINELYENTVKDGVYTICLSFNS